MTERTAKHCTDCGTPLVQSVELIKGRCLRHIELNAATFAEARRISAQLDDLERAARTASTSQGRIRMSTWKDEFDRRCRRLLEITDDSLPVKVDTEYTYWSTMTGGETSVVLICGGTSCSFMDMGDVIRALDEVDEA